MGFNFNAEEVYRIGEQIEINGEKFYRAAAAAAGDPKFKGVLADLARQEATHQARFRQMRESLDEKARQQTVFDPDGETAAYLEAAASTHVFNGEIDPKALAEQCASPREVLKTALRFEKDSIVFFLAMKEVTPASAGGASIEWLVSEEMKHIRQIGEMMKQL